MQNDYLIEFRRARCVCWASYLRFKTTKFWKGNFFLTANSLNVKNTRKYFLNVLKFLSMIIKFSTQSIQSFTNQNLQSWNLNGLNTPLVYIPQANSWYDIFYWITIVMVMFLIEPTINGRYDMTINTKFFVKPSLSAMFTNRFLCLLFSNGLNTCEHSPRERQTKILLRFFVAFILFVYDDKNFSLKTFQDKKQTIELKFVDWTSIKFSLIWENLLLTYT